MMRWAWIVAICAMRLQALAQDDATWREGLEAYWGEINEEYRDSAHTPLPGDQRAHFTELERFPINAAFRVQARFKAKGGKPFGMATTTERRPQYEAVGVLRFELAGRKERLTVYRNIDLSKKEGYEDYLFVPFTDLTNGESTYGGGRYLDLRAPLADVVELDFNRAYNPYCAYGGRYSCPIPPLENHLAVRVEAGVKAFAH